MTDSTEGIRKLMINTGQVDADLADNQGPTWNTTELQEDFDVTGFLAPFVVVVRKSDGVHGTLEFTGRPRVYFNFTPIR